MTRDDALRHQSTHNLCAQTRKMMARSGAETNSDSEQLTLSSGDWPRIKFDEVEYRVKTEFFLKLLVLFIVSITGLVLIVSTIFLLLSGSSYDITMIFVLVGSGVFLDVLCVTTLFRFTPPHIKSPPPPPPTPSASQYFDQLRQ
jgi:hypothetical protein